MNRPSMFAAAAFLQFGLVSFTWAADGPSSVATFRGSTPAIQFDVSPPLRSIVPLQAPLDAIAREIPERGTGLEGPPGPQDRDAAVQSQNGSPDMPATGVSFNGPPNVSNVSPPDPVGDVGPNHYVAMSNLSFQIFSKTGTSLYGPALNNTLWAGFGGACQTENAGDPIVVHDQFADRWVLMQFTAAGPTYFLCIAVSTTPDPTGAYFRYAISTGSNFPDYPKLGVGATAYYAATREFAGNAFAGVGAYALNRAQMVAGNPAPQVISFLVAPGASPYNIGDGLQPADIDGAVLPPSGNPHYYVGTMDNGGPYGAPQDALTLWKFQANFVTPASSSFALANTLPVAAFDSTFPCTPTGSRACIPQLGTANKLDILSYRQRALHRLAYRNFGTHESLVTNQSVQAVAGIAGIRWYEVRSPNVSPAIFQQGTYAPGASDGIHRWMGSIAMDAGGNMGLGFSASNATMYPSIGYTGRLAADPLGTMPQGEGVIVTGTGAQTGSNRWGDYTSMNVDPSDDCTFWYVNEYVPVTSSAGWQLRIGSFKFPSCGTGSLTAAKYADFNDDGKSDLSWRNASSGATSLWLMNGASYASFATVLSDPAWSITNTGDLSGDGKTDLIWRNSTSGATTAWIMNGLTYTSFATLLTDPNWSVTQVADLNGDGKADLVWRNSVSGQTAAWLMNGLAATSSTVLLGDGNWQVTKVGDFNGDGRADLVWRNGTTGATAIWLMNGLAPSSAATILVSTNWSVTHIGDFNGDGKSDLVWRNSITGATALWLMNGTAVLSSATIFADPNWSVTHVGDFNGDGKDDLAWRNAVTGHTALWLMNGTASTGNAVVMTDPNWSITHTGDYNADTKSDLAWRNSVLGWTSVWLMNGLTYSTFNTVMTDPNWLLSPADGQ